MLDREEKVLAPPDNFFFVIHFSSHNLDNFTGVLAVSFADSMAMLVSISLTLSCSSNRHSPKDLRFFIYASLLSLSPFHFAFSSLLIRVGGCFMRSLSSRPACTTVRHFKGCFHDFSSFRTVLSSNFQDTYLRSL